MKKCIFLGLSCCSILAFSLAVASCQAINIDNDELLAPVNFSVTANTEGASCTWSYVTNATSYTVYWKRDASTVSASDHTNKQENILVNSANIGPLDGDIQYAFIVIAYGPNGKASPPSAIKLATPDSPQPAPVSVISLTLHPTDTGLLRIEFSEPIGNGTVGLSLTGADSILWYNADLDGSGVLGDSPSEGGYGTADPTFVFTIVEPEPNPTPGYSTTWDITRPAAVGTGVGVQIRFSVVTEESHKIRRIGGAYVVDLLANLFVP